jgi:hypothetical protein
MTCGEKYVIGMVTSIPPSETFSLIKNNILHQSKNYKNHFENSNFWGMWTLGHVGHVTYSFINMLPSKEKIATAFVMTVIVDRSHLLHLKYMYEQCYRVINYSI